ncbi:Jag N-terminal domain-containing protein [Bacillus methanolicus]|uniref:Jag N-terminal domain-containing protein n=1 Tax=Bacillus methanolicus TaxID=1471 RepID=UPI0023801195|nr:Jag N-terminal domain-containing protein [Bacillus methanolicus]
MQSIVSKGKNIKEAIKVGLELLETTKEEVNIKIIQHETKGFLGIGSKDAIVELTKREARSSQFEKENKADPFELVEQLVSQKPDEQLEQKQLETAYTKGIINDADLINKESDSLTGKVWVKNGQIYCKSSLPIFQWYLFLIV